MRWLFLIALTGATAGCATVANDQRENIPIRSEPAGAVVSVNCGNAPIYGGVTPDKVQELTEPKLIIGDAVREIAA